MKNFYVSAVGRVIIVINNKVAPSDEEWAVFLETTSDEMKKRGDDLCVLVFTDGGAPSTAQRKRLNELLNGRSVPVAVMSNSMIPRFVVASISLFNKLIRSYAPEEMPQVCQDRGLRQEEIDKVVAALEVAQTKLKTACVETALQTKARLLGQR